MAYGAPSTARADLWCQQNPSGGAIVRHDQQSPSDRHPRNTETITPIDRRTQPAEHRQGRGQNGVAYAVTPEHIVSRHSGQMTIPITGGMKNPADDDRICFDLVENRVPGVLMSAHTGTNRNITT